MRLGSIPASVALMLSVSALSSCGSADKPSGVFTDCTTVGHVTRTTDLKRDIKPNIAVTSSGRVVPPDRPGVDLAQVTVARGEARLCADFRMAGAVSKPVELFLDLTAKTQPGPSASLAISLPASRPPSVRLIYPGSGATPNPGQLNAEVGVRRDEVSVVVDRSVFPILHIRRVTTDLRHLVFDNFKWGARSIYMPEAPFPPSLQFSDCDPYGNESISYPEGQLVAGLC